MPAASGANFELVNEHKVFEVCSNCVHEVAKVLKNAGVRFRTTPAKISDKITANDCLQTVTDFLIKEGLLDEQESDECSYSDCSDCSNSSDSSDSQR